MEVVDGALKVAHEAVDIADGGVGGGVLGDEHQGLPVVLQGRLVLPAGTNATTSSVQGVDMSHTSPCSTCTVLPSHCSHRCEFTSFTIT